MEADRVYFRRRMDEEQAAAATASHSKVRQIHLDLAACYEARLATIEARQQRTGMHLVSAA